MTDRAADPFDPADAPPPRWRVRPLYALLGAVVLGILLTPALPASPAVLLAGIGLSLGAALLLGRRPAVFVLCVLAGATLFGALRARQQAAASSAPDDISRWNGRPSLWVAGEVASEVAARPGRPGAGDQYTFTLRVRQVDDYVQTRAGSGLLRVTVFDAGKAPPPPRTGDLLWLRGRVEEPPPATNPGGFDYRAYLARYGVRATLAAKRAADVRRVGHAVPGPLAALTVALRDRAAAAARAHLSPADADLLLGMLAGERGRLPADVEDAFVRTGAMHLLTVSGLYVAAASGLVAWLLRALTAPRKLVLAVCLAAVWLFALAAGSGAVVDDIRAPALRAALCASVFLAAPLLRRVAEPRHALAFAALIVLLLDPAALRDAGAQLTFATVAALIWWMPPLERLIVPWQPGLPGHVRVCRGAVLAVVATLVAQAGSWPLSATYFHVISLIAPVANLTLAPLATALFTAGLVLTALPFAPLWPVLAAGLDLLRALASFFAAPDWAAVSLPAPPTAFTVAYYALLFAAAAVVRKRVLVPERYFLPKPTGLPLPDGERFDGGR